MDVVAAGSQKALMSPPGPRLRERGRGGAGDAAAEAGGRYYFDWERTITGQRKDPPDSPFTPAVALFMALDVALGLIEEEGLEKVFERHRLLGRATREARVKALDLDLFGPEDDNANVVTAIKLPEAIDGAKVPKTCATASASRSRAARRSSRARSPGSRTAATSAPSTSWPRSRRSR